MEFFLARWVGGNILPRDKASTIRVDLETTVSERLLRSDLMRTILSSRRKITATNMIPEPFPAMDLRTVVSIRHSSFIRHTVTDDDSPESRNSKQNVTVYTISITSGITTT
jgi:hypothetical protein